MVCAAALFAAMGAATRLASLERPHLSPYAIAMARFCIGGAFVVVMFATGLRRLRWVNRRWIVVRGVMGGYTATALFWSIANLGLAKSVLYAHTFPVFAALAAGPILRERLALGHWLSIGAAILGIEVVAGFARVSFSSADLVGISVGLTWGVAVVSVTKCRETDDATNIFWSQCIFGMALTAWPAAHCWVWPSPAEWATLLIIGALAVGAQLAMTYSLRYTGATYGSLLCLLTPVLSTLLAVTVLGERLPIEFWGGGALILMACVCLAVRPVQREQRPASELGD